ncbi:MAG: hypothetical protein MO853_09705 [Candidatus Protistobacter heckmanni]|nr:hypothetical protein [Candidatus Protistobacter heckmanni]
MATFDPSHAQGAHADRDDDVITRDVELRGGDAGFGEVFGGAEENVGRGGAAEEVGLHIAEQRNVVSGGDGVVAFWQTHEDQLGGADAGLDEEAAHWLGGVFLAGAVQGNMQVARTHARWRRGAFPLHRR